MASVEALLRALALVDRRAAVWCACQCARTVLHLVSEGDARPRVAIERAEAWTRGEATEDDARLACRGAIGAAPFAVARTACRIFALPHLVPRATTEAVRDAVREVKRSGSHADSVRAQRNATDRQFATLLALVSAERWPLVVPASAERRGADQAVQVVWDLVTKDTHRRSQAMSELLEAHASAERLELDWSDPVERGLAERITHPHEERARRLLTSGRRPSPAGLSLPIPQHGNDLIGQ